MKRFVPAAALAVILALVCQPAFAAKSNAPGGRITNTDGQTIEVVRFVDLVSTLPFMYEQSDQSAPLSDIKSLTDLGNGYVILENIKGQSFKVVVMMNAVSLGEMINYMAKDPISGEVKKARIDGVFVKRIQFDWK